MGQNFWVVAPPAPVFIQSITKYVKGELSAVLTLNSVPGLLSKRIGLFWVIALINVRGLTPYTFTPTRHLRISMALALPLWVGHMALSTVSLPSNALAHLVPTGTPVALMPFMVLIEIIRNLIRPITLSVRLAANIIAGHLLIVLLGNMGAPTNLSLRLLVIMLLALLVVLERAVALIQAYVFSVLSTLYLQDVNSPML